MGILERALRFGTQSRFDTWEPERDTRREPGENKKESDIDSLIVFRFAISGV